jgi:hypothetical protein
MTKTNEAISDIMQNSKHAFRKVGDRSAKAHRTRSERRKLKQHLNRSDWQENLE